MRQCGSLRIHHTTCSVGAFGLASASVAEAGASAALGRLHLGQAFGFAGSGPPPPRAGSGSGWRLARAAGQQWRFFVPFFGAGVAGRPAQAFRPYTTEKSGLLGGPAALVASFWVEYLRCCTTSSSWAERPGVTEIAKTATMFRLPEMFVQLPA